MKAIHVLLVCLLGSSLLACAGRLPQHEQLHHFTVDAEYGKTLVEVLPTDAGMEGDRLTYNLILNPIGQFNWIDQSKGLYRYDPTPNPEAYDRIQYRVSNGERSSQVVTVQINIKKTPKVIGR
jgi:hypothetical protein